MNAVNDAFNMLSPMSLNNVFLSLQGCLLETMKLKGHNTYNIPHMKKAALIRANQLPLTLEVPVQLIKECIIHLLDVGGVAGVADIILKLGIEGIEGV